MWRRLRTGSINVLLILGGLGLGLVVAEIIVGKAAPQDLPLTVVLRHLHIPDPELGYVMAPDFSRHVRTAGVAVDVRTNSLGLRDTEPRPADPQTLRVVGLGDSFVFGIHAGGLEKLFLKRLEEQVGARLAQDRSAAWRACEFINAGVDGYGTSQEIGLLERLAPQLQPHAVLVGFYLGNDFADNAGRTRMTVVDGYQMLEASAEPYRNFSRPLHRKLRIWLHANSQLYLLVKRRLLHPARNALASALPGQRRSADRSSNSKSFDYYVYDSGFAASLEATESAMMQQALVATAAAFDRLRHWSTAQNASVLVFAIPAEQQVDPAARESWLRRFDLDAARFDFELPNRRLQQLAMDAGLAFHDLTPAFRDRIARGEALHRDDDKHWTAAGHAAAADELLQPVLEHLARTPAPLIGTR